MYASLTLDRSKGQKGDELSYNGPQVYVYVEMLSHPSSTNLGMNLSVFVHMH